LYSFCLKNVVTHTDPGNMKSDLRK